MYALIEKFKEAHGLWLILYILTMVLFFALVVYGIIWLLRKRANRDILNSPPMSKEQEEYISRESEDIHLTEGELSDDERFRRGYYDSMP